MEKNNIESVEPVIEGEKEKGSKKEHRFRDTVLIRASRKLRDEAMSIKGQPHKTLSKIVDEALGEYIMAVKRRMDY